MILIGASGHAKVLLDILLQQGIVMEVFYDAHPPGTELFGVPVYPQGDLVPQGQQGLIAVGNNRIRKTLAEQYALTYITAVHPQAAVSAFAVIGEGTVVMAQAAVNAAALVGRHCIINTGAVVEHDCVLEDFVHISPNASLAGGVMVGEGTHIGIGASVIPGVRIGRWATVGAGAVVLRDVPDFATVVGNPAREIGSA